MTQSVTKLLIKWSENGDRDVLDEIFPLVYAELRKLAAHHLQMERADHTLQPTALVHEAYLRLVDQRSVNFESRAQFFALSAKVMRNILVNHAKARQAKKRGGRSERITICETTAAFPAIDLDVLALDESLEKLAAVDEQKSHIVELKFFGGLTNEETAVVVGRSVATIEREWTFARAWLHSRLAETV